MGKQRRLKSVAIKRKVELPQNQNANSVNVSESKRQQNCSLPTKDRNNNKSKTVKTGRGRGKLTPKRLNLGNKPLNETVQCKSEILTANETNAITSVHQGQPDQDRSRHVVAAEVHNVAAIPVTEQIDDNEIMPNDGVELSVPESEDNFCETDYSDCDEREEADAAQIGQSDESDLEITMSTRKKFLCRELEKDPQLREVFDDMVNEKVER